MAWQFHHYAVVKVTYLLSYSIATWLDDQVSSFVLILFSYFIFQFLIKRRFPFLFEWSPKSLIISPNLVVYWLQPFSRGAYCIVAFLDFIFLLCRC